MNDHELLRYSKQIMLPQIDIEGQQKINDSTILIIGMGGLGSPTALYLAAAGVGHIIIADFDSYDLFILTLPHHSINVCELLYNGLCVQDEIHNTLTLYALCVLI